MRTFLSEICSFLYFIHKNMGTDFCTWSMKSVFHGRKSSCVCLVMIYGILHVSHMDIGAHIFLHEYRILYYTQKGIWAYIFQLEVWKFLFHKWITQLNFLTGDMWFSIVLIWHCESKLSFLNYWIYTLHEWKSR